MGFAAHNDTRPTHTDQHTAHSHTQRSLPAAPAGGSPTQRPRRPRSPHTSVTRRAGSAGSATEDLAAATTTHHDSADFDDSLLACIECPSSVLGATPLPEWPPLPPPRTALAPPPADATWASSDDVATLLANLRACENESWARAEHDYIETRHGADAAPGGGHLDPSMRSLTVSWMVEVAAEYGLHTETLAVAVSLLDRFLSAARRVHRSALQLAALAALLVATKHEEAAFPPAAELATLAGGGCAGGDVVRMEAAMLQAVGFRVAAPTPAAALALLARHAAAPPAIVARATYLLELALLAYEALVHAPSALAAAAIVLAARADDAMSSSPSAASAAAATASIVCDGALELEVAAHCLVALHAAAADRAATLVDRSSSDGAPPADTDAVDALDAVVAKFSAREWACVALEPALA